MDKKTPTTLVIPLIGGVDHLNTIIPYANATRAASRRNSEQEKRAMKINYTIDEIVANDVGIDIAQSDAHVIAVFIRESGDKRRYFRFVSTAPIAGHGLCLKWHGNRPPGAYAMWRLGEVQGYNLSHANSVHIQRMSRNEYTILVDCGAGWSGGLKAATRGKSGGIALIKTDQR